LNAPDYAAFDVLPSQIALVDIDGAIVATNKSWDDVAHIGCLGSGERRLNYLAECRAAEARGCVEAGRVADAIRQVLAGSAAAVAYTYPCAFGGRHHWFQATVAPAGGDRAVVMHVDVTALEHDNLTGLANRALFEAQAEVSLSAAIGAGSAMSVLLIDLNKFKPVNDGFGHLAGDHVLKTTAERLRAVIRDGDLAARFGGDEFAVVLAPDTPPGAVASLIRRMQAELERPVAFEGCKLAVGVSIGAGIYPADGATVAELVAAADARMYGMKRGRLIA